MGIKNQRFHREVLKRLPSGYSIEPAEHPTLIGPNGEPVRDDRGMLVRLPGSPGDRRAFISLLTRLRRMGIDVKR